MQTVLYVFAKSGKQKSLREAICSDLNKWEYDGQWEVVFQHAKNRANGWAKIKRRGCYGALNIEWDADAKTLVGRAVSRNGNHPNELVGDFVAYLLRWHRTRISSITMRTL